MISVFIVPRDEDVAVVREGVEDLAFDATTGLAQLAHIEIASDEWQEIYREVLASYQEASKYLLYFLHLGITAVKMQLEMGALRLVVPSLNAAPDPSEIAEAVLNAAKPLAACLLHVASVGDRMLISDDEIHELTDGVLTLGVGLTVNRFTNDTNQEKETK